ncbi:hypothetical protein Pcinc_030061 [Petrolisthes cinctipes]|uniref:GDNF/GAS1 domain-containing protein n=1 Tax=Petrolisthes cinctipes TaxID=88211 RepID=A0AAE1EZK1_PETCI|nr:hypothetical protein Pcinc_030061 [Petrolisthes cinctipes]
MYLVKVACSTVTVSRCQAALRTLVQFSWFQPTCLCREPRLDPQCNAFRDLLFDHPCVFVNRKEVDLHPLQYIPTCEVAADICRHNRFCHDRLEAFRDACKFRDGRCRTRYREDCLTAWLQLRATPLLGCICPDGLDKKCARLYSLVNENPCVGSGYPGRVAAMSRVGASLGSPLTLLVPVPTAAATLLIISSHADPLYPLSNTHHHAQHLPPPNFYTGKASNPVMNVMLGSHLELVSSHCDAPYCNKEACRSSIQDIYKYLLDNNHDLALKIALCVCRDSKEDSYSKCLRGQRRLHPPCAIMSESTSVSQCHNLGRDCRSDRVCRYRLEHYELSCAADTVTGRCAGQHQECTKALLGLLGSDLHTNCVCKGNAFQDISQCLAWKRLIWGNPCVVESQLTYHLTQVGLTHDMLLSSLTSHHDAQVDPRGENDPHHYGHGVPPHLPPSQAGAKSTSSHYSQDGYVRYNSQDDRADEEDRVAVVEARKVAGSSSTSQSDHTLPNAAPAYPESTPIPHMTTVYIPPTTKRPERFCDVPDPQGGRPHVIEEHDSIRLYKGVEQECPQVCECVIHGKTECRVLECLEKRPCETGFTLYSQINRGECVCYSGDFICQRPREEDFRLSTGLFLLLGFSKTEERILRPVNNGGAVEALVPLQILLRNVAASMGAECGVELIMEAGSNLVLQVYNVPPTGIIPSNYTDNLPTLHQERERCLRPLSRVAHMFIHREPRIKHDVRLSLFKLAEVVDNVPSPQRISSSVGLRPCCCNLAVTDYFLPPLTPTARLSLSRSQSPTWLAQLAFFEQVARCWSVKLLTLIVRQ